MEKDLKDELREVISDVITPLVVKFEASHDSHAKELERLTKQSGEHYNNYKGLEEKMQKQIQRCQNVNGETQEKSGLRIGSLEQTVARIDEHVNQNTDDIKEMRSNKQFNISQWLVAVGVIAAVGIGIAQLLKG